MIYLFTAMYCEAYPLIRQYQLKKETDQTHFQVFSNESLNICLTITGTGMIAAATAVSSVCTKYPPKDNDFLINIGICAGTSKEGELFLCNRITEQTTGKTFYPDILYRHSFFETQVITGARPFRKEDLEKSQETCLYDMEASAIYQSGSYFFGPHQMFFLKTISDGGDFERVTPKQAQCRIADHMDAIAAFLDRLNEIRNTAGIPFEKNDEINKDAEMPEKENPIFQKNLEQLCKDMHCSHVMSASLRQHIRYCILSGVDYQTVIDEMYREQKLPCRDKREGKLRFEELGKRLL